MDGTLDVARLRAETPGVKGVIHFNNAGSSLPPVAVTDAIKAHLDLESELGGYEAARARDEELSGVYDAIARLIGATPDTIACVPNATVAWQCAFYGMSFAPGDRILTARAEYAANYVAYLQMSKRTGCSIEIIPDDMHGASDPDALDAMIDERVKLISLTWIPTNGGLVNPAAKIGAVARRHEVPYLLDACQAAGQMPVDVEALGCDFLAATGRKFLRGPRGTGFLYVHRRQLAGTEPAMIDHFGAPWRSADTYELRADARRYETWERSPALQLGLGAAASYALERGLEAISDRCSGLAGLMRRELALIPGLEIADLGERPCAIVSFSYAGRDAASVARHLSARKINASVTPPSSTLLDADARNLAPLVRVSPHYYNTEEEVGSLVDALSSI